MAWWDEGFYPASRPLAVKGGIRARSRRGFGESWWARRWIRSLEMLGMGGRLSRGATYARSGQVASLEVRGGRVDAVVQGSRPDPYDVVVRLSPLPRSRWSRAAKVIEGRAGLVARLLAGEMPFEVEEELSAAGASLFPARRGELETSCTCPDPVNPCKHIAAVHYILAEEIDRDPFVLLALRGLSREELLELVGAGRSRDEEDAGDVPAPPVELSADPGSFWSGGGLPAIPWEEPAGDERAAALLRRLGPFPLWRGEADLQATLVPAHVDASRLALGILSRTPERAALEPEEEEQASPAPPEPGDAPEGPGSVMRRRTRGGARRGRASSSP